MSHAGSFNITLGDSESHYAAIGKMASNWAALEAIVTSSIWQSSEVADAVGACITAQIYTFDGKIKALSSILNVRGGFEKVISDLNKFHADARSIATFRNRILHDPLFFDEEGTPQRLQITADKKPVYGYIDEPTDNVIAQAGKAADLLDRFQEIMKPVFERYKPLPLHGKS